MFLRKTLDWGHHLVKVTYDYMLELAARKNAMLFLFIVAFVESSFFPIPPDIMLIPMVLATPGKSLPYCGTGYGCQRAGWLFRLSHRCFRI